MRKRETQAWFFEIGAVPDATAEELLQPRPKFAPGMHWEPRADVLEEEQKILIMVDLAGVIKEEIQISFASQENVVVIKGVRKELLEADVKRKAHQLEVFFGPFAKAIVLPNLALQIADTSAIYKNGVLYISIPKADSQQMREDEESSSNQ